MTAGVVSRMATDIGQYILPGAGLTKGLQAARKYKAVRGVAERAAQALSGSTKGKIAADVIAGSPLDVVISQSEEDASLTGIADLTGSTKMKEASKSRAARNVFELAQSGVALSVVTPAIEAVKGYRKARMLKGLGKLTHERLQADKAQAEGLAPAELEAVFGSSGGGSQGTQPSGTVPIRRPSEITQNGLSSGPLSSERADMPPSERTETTKRSPSISQVPANDVERVSNSALSLGDKDIRSSGEGSTRTLGKFAESSNPVLREGGRMLLEPLAATPRGVERLAVADDYKAKFGEIPKIEARDEMDARVYRQPTADENVLLRAIAAAHPTFVARFRTWAHGAGGGRIADPGVKPRESTLNKTGTLPVAARPRHGRRSIPSVACPRDARSNEKGCGQCDRGGMGRAAGDCRIPPARI